MSFTYQETLKPCSDVRGRMSQRGFQLDSSDSAGPKGVPQYKPPEYSNDCQLWEDLPIIKDGENDL